MSGISKNVGITIDATLISAGINTDLNLDIAQVEIPGFANGFKTVKLHAKSPAVLPFMVGIHTNVSVEYAGKPAYIFKKNSATGQYSLDRVMLVNEAGNIATFTNEITDFMIMIAD